MKRVSVMIIYLLQIADVDTECSVDMLGTRTTRLPSTANCCADKNTWLEQYPRIHRTNHTIKSQNVGSFQGFADLTDFGGLSGTDLNFNSPK